MGHIFFLVYEFSRRKKRKVENRKKRLLYETSFTLERLSNVISRLTMCTIYTNTVF